LKSGDGSKPEPISVSPTRARKNADLPPRVLAVGPNANAGSDGSPVRALARAGDQAGNEVQVVDATIAQPIEAQVVGVDKMIYMKSDSSAACDRP
jgi:hypothetical protein